MTSVDGERLDPRVGAYRVVAVNAEEEALPKVVCPVTLRVPEEVSPVLDAVARVVCPVAVN